MTKEELAVVLEKHAKYLRGEEGGSRANLSGANLSRANDGGSGCYVAPSVTFKTYLDELVPALCTAGGRSLDDVANPTVWGCHSLDNCPMAEAFGVHDIGKVPVLYREQAALFVTLFDNKQIPLGRVNPKFKDAAPADSCKVE